MSASSLLSSASMFSVLDTEIKIYGEQGNKQGGISLNVGLFL